MFLESVVDRSMQQAYRETDFVIHGDVTITLNIGLANPTLVELHKAHGVKFSGFVTACNPFSKAFDEAANFGRQAALADELDRLDLVYLAGTGQHPSNKWPGEPSFLVLGLSREAARLIGMQYKQNAVVWCGLNAVPELVLLR